MDIYTIIIFICLILSLNIVLSFKVSKGVFLNLFFKGLIILETLKYISLLIFYVIESPGNIYSMRFIPMFSIVSLFAIGYIMIYCSKDKTLKLKNWLVILLFLVVGVYIVFNLSIGIENTNFGYKIIKNKNWTYIASFFIILSSFLMIAVSLKTVFYFKKVGVKIYNLLLSLSFLVLAVEEVFLVMSKEIFPFSIIGDLTLMLSITIIFLMKRNLKDKNKVKV